MAFRRRSSRRCVDSAINIESAITRCVSHATLRFAEHSLGHSCDLVELIARPRRRSLTGAAPGRWRPPARYTHLPTPGRVSPCRKARNDRTATNRLTVVRSCMFGESALNKASISASAPRDGRSVGLQTCSTSSTTFCDLRSISGPDREGEIRSTSGCGRKIVHR